ncbi:Polyketide cyclase / dehydrase and lipid transport [Cohnella sp. OV330]|uniref:SRPBCC family protein n=1 Tax=Cohnella sp. OV330 TaxID=1855288 RepID=UPI0008F01294|nr:SRPBCC family protein [Cohnella sp. OV330]SFB53746.1 Polyketide cyclase / dehydrase and lipid transport [Cohnella sp. OV330]
MSDSIYRFEHAWRVNRDKERLWALIGDFRYDDWWPNVRIERIATGASGDGLGNVYASEFRPGLLYALKLRVSVVESRPPTAVALRVAGDLEGRAVVRLHGVGRATEVHVLMELETRRGWMSALAPLLRDVFVRNHRRMIEDGIAGLAAYLDADIVPGSVHAPYRRLARG